MPVPLMDIHAQYAGLLDDDFAATDEPVERSGGLIEELRRRTVRR